LGWGRFCWGGWICLWGGCRGISFIAGRGLHFISAGDFGGGERGVVDFDVFDWEVEAVMAFVFFPSLLGTGQKP
jgi:hypothetical protein